MEARAVIVEAPERLRVDRVRLKSPTDADCVVQVDWSGISTGTEKLLYTGAMPPFPGLGYPLVPGYESTGIVVEAGPASGRRVGERVFVPGSNGFEDGLRGLFGGAASRLVARGDRLAPLDPGMGREGALLALAATALHAVDGGRAPDLIVGHGALGRLMARIVVARGGAPTVWEVNPARTSGAEGYAVVHPDADPRRDYGVICDVSGDASILDSLIGRLAPGGEVVLAGFYAAITFTFPPAFMREARLRVAAEWKPADLIATRALIESGALSLGGLITHEALAADAPAAYRTAFGDASCLKMILDWRADA